MVIAEHDEYHGLGGEIVGVTQEGKVLVDVEMPGPKYRVPFDPHDIELAALVEKT